MKKKSIVTFVAGMFSVLTLSLVLAFLQFVSPVSLNTRETRTLHQNNASVSTRAEVEALTSVSDLDPDFTAAIQQSAHTSRAQAYVVKFTSEVYNFVLGYYGEGEQNYPFSLSYYYTTTNGQSVEAVTEFELKSSINNYDGIGPEIGDDTLTFYLDIDVPAGGVIDRDSLIFFNVFYVDDVQEGPDFTTNYKINKIKTTSSAKQEIDLDKYFTAKLTGLSHFANFACFNVDFTNNSYDLYYERKQSYVDDTCKEGLDAGTLQIVYDFPALSNAYFAFYYNDGSIVKRYISEDSITTTLRTVVGTTKFKFVIPDVDFNGLERVAINALAYKIRIVTQEDKEQVGTSLNTRFASLWFQTDSGTLEGVGSLDLILILIIVELAYIAVYVALALAYYFYAKNKFKNDEFRRINEREYLKTAILTGLGIDVFVLDILVIIFRFAIFNNNITVFNPIDNFVVILSVIFIFFAGYFIKRAIAAIKEARARHEAKRLQLNEKSDDSDGTN